MNVAGQITKHRWFITLLILAVAFFLRMYRIDQSPPSPYWEEAAIGYDAYSILKTGRDHHGNPFPIVAFESFGDFKPTLYFYAVVPFIALFGLNVVAVRMPAVIAGTLIVWGVGLIGREVGKVGSREVEKSGSVGKMGKLENGEIAEILYTIAMLVTAISPWAIQFSRAGWEVNLATCLVTFGAYFGLRSWQREETQNFASLLISAVLLILSMYAYHSTRLIAPLLGVGIIIPWLLTFKKDILKILGTGFVSVVLLLPLIFSLGNKTTSQRFAETSIFSDLTILEESNRLIAEDGNTFTAKIFHHRYLGYGNQIAQNFLSHFHPLFLFIAGDDNPRHSVQYFGQLYYTEFFLILISVFAIIYFKIYSKREWMFLIYWLLVGILPAALTKATPHALRILPTLPVWMMIISFGITQLIIYVSRLEYKKYLLSTTYFLLLTTYAFQFAMFYHYYQKVYPVIYSSHWQYGYQEMISSVNALRQNDEPVFITREQGRPAMYYWFYSQTDPQLVQQASASVTKDQSEFLAFEHVAFVDQVNTEMMGLIASSPAKYEDVGGEIIKEITDPRGKVIWVLYRR